MTSSATRRVLPHYGAVAARWRGRRILLGVGAALVLSACGSFGSKPSRVEGSIAAAAGLNPSVNDRPSPLLLRVYELRNATAFNQADFMGLYQSDQATLSADLVVREEIMLQPGESRPFNRQLSPETRFIGVVAIYRNLERATWRALVPVEPNKAHRLTVRADSLAVSAEISP